MADTFHSVNPAHPNEAYIRLVPLQYVGAVPMPHAACTEPTPDEQRRRANEEEQQKFLRRQEECDAIQKDSSADNTTSTGGMFGKVKSAVTHAALCIEKGASGASAAAKSQMRHITRQVSNDRFRQHFPEMARDGETLLADYSCAAMHNGTRVEGHLMITRHFLCFCAQTSSVFANVTETLFEAVKSGLGDGAKQGGGKPVCIKEVIPLIQIASIQRSVVLETVLGSAPYFLPIPADTVVPTALQVYSPEGNKLFQFFNFSSLTDKAGGALMNTCKSLPLERAYNYLDHAWREAVKVPLDGVQYA